ncbi:endonuclease/exonuclease/phosphatase family protein [Stenotrophomonas rhizophila]|uniref:endonuclease/exonuclease/phosphatase family protein n=1 Tax=Stenotrophomonas rhizophila TaxID=216778 RepID=UPI0028D03C58|nr:endonuclease/exonuclease/phosphatase family protein [Stenotrophomonas rhizophila]MDY0954075.1 endonuclease/exonuclease/phosphatase family protein [Stenotrophomonas rhizophila]
MHRHRAWLRRGMAGLLASAALLAGVALAAEPVAVVTPAPAPSTSAAPGMSMVTFNLHHDREDWPARRKVILRELQALRPDAIALQEVIQKPHVRNQAAWLARKLGYDYQFVSTDPPGRFKRYGNALLTRRPVLARNDHLLAPLGDYRTVAHLRIDVDGQPVNVYATHLNERSDDSGSRIRGEQVADLLKFIATTSGTAPVVIAGDFNALVDAGDLSELRNHYGDSFGSVHVNNELAQVSTLNRHYYEAPSRIDHIFFQQDRLLAREARILFDQPYAEGRWASDHYGVWTRLQFAPSPGSPAATTP